MSNKVCTSQRVAALFLSLTITSVGVAVVVGLMVVKPGYEGLNFTEETRCAVTSSKIGATLKCVCGQHCSSTFPCLTVKVSYNLHNGTTINNATLHENEVEYQDYPQCSRESCQAGGYTNNERIYKFMHHYGVVGENYTCFYHKKSPDKVILKEKFNGAAVYSAIVIPLLLLLGSVIGLTVTCCSMARQFKSPVAVTMNGSPFSHRRLNDLSINITI